MPRPLDAYNKKRDFSRTPEPRPKRGAKKGHAFVIQKHDATRLHYDFRLELDGVMKSWAVTRGPSLLPAEKRLAVQTEDHPIDYNSFEGVIPKGQYGGGTVMIWDKGVWTPEGDPHKGLKKGHLEFTLEGEKLRGKWHLVKMKKKPREKAEPWLLIKSDDEEARTEKDPDILEEMDRSVVSGRTIPEIAASKDRVWNSNRDDKSKSREEKPKTAKPKKPTKLVDKIVQTAKKGRLKFIEPQLATLVAKPPSSGRWVHEVKFDGYRLQAHLKDGKVTLYTRNGLDWSHRFPNICSGLATLPVSAAIIDGEAIVEDENGVSSFSALQQDLGGRGGRLVSGKAIYYAFDLLHFDDRDLTGLPLLERKEALAAIVAEAPHEKIRLSEHFETDANAMLQHACKLGLEGIIAKRIDAPYRSGRNDNWLKLKCIEGGEFVIAGYVPSTVSQGMVGSLVMGYFDKGKLVHIGRVGTGFTRTIAQDLKKRIEKVASDASPFAEKLSADARRGVKWAKPVLVAEIDFRGWTHDGSLRHASFKGLREDKEAKDVGREIAKPAPGTDTKPPPAKAKAKTKQGVAVAGVPLSHPERVLWEDASVTKQDLAEFYEAIADWILPHIVDRPLSLVRCPSGTSAKCFFQKHAWAGLGPGIREIEVPGDTEEMLAIKDISGLVSLVQSSVLEIHPWGARLPKLTMPDQLIFDLDPGDGVEWPQVVEGAHEVRARLAEMKLESFVKATGGKGLHVVVPLKPEVEWDMAKAFAKAVAEQMAGDTPSRYVSTMSKKIRAGRVFIDYLRNGQGATAIAAYSTRARKGAPVAVPLSWKELGPDVKGDHFSVANVRKRLDALKKDPWEGFFKARQSLKSVLKAARLPRK